MFEDVSLDPSILIPMFVGKGIIFADALQIHFCESLSSSSPHAGIRTVGMCCLNRNKLPHVHFLSLLPPDIPYFQEVVLMAINCSLCGYRSNEVKSIAGIAERGKKFRLLIATEEDLSRDILKSDTASVALPELGIDSEPGTLGGHFTTVEGLLGLMRDKACTPVLLLIG